MTFDLLPEEKWEECSYCDNYGVGTYKTYSKRGLYHEEYLHDQKECWWCHNTPTSVYRQKAEWNKYYKAQLRPCPYCYKEVNISWQSIDCGDYPSEMGWAIISEEDCFCGWLGDYLFDTREELISKWNGGRSHSITIEKPLS